MSLLLASAGLALLATASPQPPPPEPAPSGRPAAEAGKMVDAYLLSNLQESLGLTDEQFVKLLPLVKRQQSERRELGRRRGKAVRELRKLLNSGAATESQIAEALQELKAVENEGPVQLQRSREGIDSLLTPLQQAKFRVLEMEVEQKIRDLMSQIRRQGQPTERPPRNRPPQEP